jgi:hypothetical protein
VFLKTTALEILALKLSAPRRLPLGILSILSLRILTLELVLQLPALELLVLELPILGRLQRELPALELLALEMWGGETSRSEMWGVKLLALEMCRTSLGESQLCPLTTLIRLLSPFLIRPGGSCPATIVVMDCFEYLTISTLGTLARMIWDTRAA